MAGADGPDPFARNHAPDEVTRIDKIDPSTRVLGGDLVEDKFYWVVNQAKRFLSARYVGEIVVNGVRGRQWEDVQHYRYRHGRGAYHGVHLFVTGEDPYPWPGTYQTQDRYYAYYPDRGRMRPLKNAIGRKAKDQAVRDMYDKATRDPSRLDEYGKPMAQSGAPGHGPADMIRKAMGVQPPRGAMGGRTRRRRSRSTRDLGSRKSRRRHR